MTKYLLSVHNCLGEFTANFKDTYSLYSPAYSLMCESSIMQIIHKLLASC